MVAPPSTHPSGTQYTWSEYCSPAEHEVSELPADLLDQAQESTRHTPEKQNKVSEYKYICSSSPCPPAKSRPVASSVPDGDLAEWACREEVALSVMRLCGVTVTKLGGGFRCPLPGHEERKASAALWRQADGSIGFHDFHRKSGSEWFSLAEVYAAVKSGCVRKLRPGEKAVWLLRALVEAELIKAPVVMASRMPTRAKCSGEKLGMPSKAIASPSQSESPIRKMPGSKMPMISPA